VADLTPERLDELERLYRDAVAGEVDPFVAAKVLGKELALGVVGVISQAREVFRLRAENAELAAACEEAVSAFEIEVPSGCPTIARMRAAIAKHREGPCES
jgi:hypothetical protein